MAEYTTSPNGKVDIKFHQKPTNYKRVEKLTLGKTHYELCIDKNDQVYDVLLCTVKSWKAIEKGKRKFTVPDVIVKHRDVELFDRIKGRPTPLAIGTIQAIYDSASVTV